MPRMRHASFCIPAIVSALVLSATPAFAQGVPQSPGTQGSGEMILSNKIIGANVKNSKGETVGEIKNLVIDHESGQILLATLSAGGFLGIADSIYPVPWKAFQVRRDEGAAGAPSARQQPPAGGYGGGPAGTERGGGGGAMGQSRQGERGGLFSGRDSVTLILDVDKQKLQNAPKLENEAQLKDRSFLQQVNSHYGVQSHMGTGGGRMR